MRISGFQETQGILSISSVYQTCSKQMCLGLTLKPTAQDLVPAEWVDQEVWAYVMCCRQCFRSNSKEIGFIKVAYYIPPSISEGTLPGRHAKGFPAIFMVGDCGTLDKGSL